VYINYVIGHEWSSSVWCLRSNDFLKPDPTSSRIHFTVDVSGLCLSKLFIYVFYQFHVGS
jgi:hypothetical protein